MFWGQVWLQISKASKHVCLDEEKERNANSSIQTSFRRQGWCNFQHSTAQVLSSSMCHGLSPAVALYYSIQLRIKFSFMSLRDMFLYRQRSIFWFSILKTKSKRSLIFLSCFETSTPPSLCSYNILVCTKTTQVSMVKVVRYFRDRSFQLCINCNLRYCSCNCYLCITDSVYQIRVSGSPRETK